MIVVPYKGGVAVNFDKPIVKYIKSKYSKVRRQHSGVARCHSRCVHDVGASHSHLVVAPGRVQAA